MKIGRAARPAGPGARIKSRTRRGPRLRRNPEKSSLTRPACLAANMLCIPPPRAMIGAARRRLIKKLYLAGQRVLVRWLPKAVSIALLAVALCSNCV